MVCCDVNSDHTAELSSLSRTQATFSNMPPPKKPKRGPTSVDQFLSKEEIAEIERQLSPGICLSSSSGSDSPPILQREDFDDDIQMTPTLLSSPMPEHNDLMLVDRHTPSKTEQYMEYCATRSSPTNNSCVNRTPERHIYENSGYDLSRVDIQDKSDNYTTQVTYESDDIGHYTKNGILSSSNIEPVNLCKTVTTSRGLLNSSFQIVERIDQEAILLDNSPTKMQTIVSLDRVKQEKCVRHDTNALGRDNGKMSMIPLSMFNHIGSESVTALPQSHPRSHQPTNTSPYSLFKCGAVTGIHNASQLSSLNTSPACRSQMLTMMMAIPTNGLWPLSPIGSQTAPTSVTYPVSSPHPRIQNPHKPALSLSPTYSSHASSNSPLSPQNEHRTSHLLPQSLLSKPLPRVPELNTLSETDIARAISLSIKPPICSFRTDAELISSPSTSASLRRDTPTTVTSPVRDMPAMSSVAISPPAKLVDMDYNKHVVNLLLTSNGSSVVTGPSNNASVMSEPIAAMVPLRVNSGATSEMSVPVYVDGLPGPAQKTPTKHPCRNNGHERSIIEKTTHHPHYKLCSSDDAVNTTASRPSSLHDSGAITTTTSVLTVPLMLSSVISSQSGETVSTSVSSSVVMQSSEGSVAPLHSTITTATSTVNGFLDIGSTLGLPISVGGDITQLDGHLNGNVQHLPTSSQEPRMGPLSGGGVISMEGSPSNNLITTNYRDVVVKREEPTPGPSAGNLRQCQVCSDTASGFHYGVWSCEGCKAFFKRSIQGPVDYVCPATNTCTIDKHRRKSCQACRLRKCYEVGMNKGHTHRKERRSSSTANNMTSIKSPKIKRSKSDTGEIINGSRVKKMRQSMILDALLHADTPLLESFHNHNDPPTKVHLLTSLIRLVDRELVYLINWAKHVPGYTELVLSDQVHLIECCWMELLLLSAAFRSMEYQGKQIAFAPDLVLDRSQWHMMGLSDCMDQIAAISAQMSQLAVHNEELLVLKAISLTNAEIRQLSNPSLIVHMRNSLLEALGEVSHRHHAKTPQQLPQLLLLLAHVRQASLQTVAQLRILKEEDTVPFCDLLREMLDAEIHHIEQHKQNTDGMNDWSAGT